MQRTPVHPALVLFTLVALTGTSQAQMQMGPTTGHDVLLFSSVFRGVATPGPYFYLDQAIVDYGPGAFSAAGSERSNRFFTVMEGTLKFTVGHETNAYGPGKFFSVPPGTIVRGFNESQTAKARAFISSLVPASGAAAAAVPGTRESLPPPVRAYASRLAVGPLPKIIDVYQNGHRYEPGFVTMPHVMNETHDILQLEGTNIYEYLDGGVETYGPGRASPMWVGRPGTMGNKTSAPSLWVITYVATPGKPLTSPLH